MMKLTELVRTLYDADQPQGCTEEEIAAVRARFGVLPAVVEEFWRTVGRTKRVNSVQDTWIFPEHYAKWAWLDDYDALILLHENQGVCRAGIRREDLALPDPPVYTQMEDGGPWLLSAPTTSAFLEAALLYESVFQLECSPEEFFELPEEDLAVIQEKLTRQPAVLKHWMEMEVTFYSSRPDNLVAVMELGGEYGGYQMLYGGATPESYEALLEVMEDLGEAI